MKLHRLLLALLAGAAALWIARHLAEAGHLWSRAARLGTDGWLLAGAGMAASYAARAARVQSEWRGLVPLRFVTCLRVVLLHSAAINVLPMRSGEMGYPLLMRRAAGIAPADALASLAWMRLQDAVVLAWLAALALLVMVTTRGGWPTSLQAAMALSATLLLLAGVRQAELWVPASLAWGRRKLAGRKRWPAAARLLDSLARAAARGAERSTGATWAWTVLNWLVKLGTVAVLLNALAGAPPLAAWAGALSGEFAMALPLQPAAGFGTYELGVAAGMATAVGHGLSESMWAALFVHLFIVAASVIGATLSWRGLDHPPSCRTEGTSP